MVLSYLFYFMQITLLESTTKRYTQIEFNKYRLASFTTKPFMEGQRRHLSDDRPETKASPICQIGFKAESNLF